MLIHKETIDFKKIRELLDSGERVMLFIRHSERPPICTDDKEFGRHLALTERGIAMAVEAGGRFKGVARAAFFASPMQRCRMTAEHIAAGMGITGAEIVDAPQIGVTSFYMNPDSHAVQALMKQRGYMQFMVDYLNQGSAPHMNDIEPATRTTLEWMRTAACEGLTVFVSHDMYITAFLTALGVRRFHGSDWIGFLHAAVVSRNPHTGAEHCYYAVPCLTAHSAPAHFAH
jgi:broad specificity phosphatase PhoE